MSNDSLLAIHNLGFSVCCEKSQCAKHKVLCEDLQIQVDVGDAGSDVALSRPPNLAAAAAAEARATKEATPLQPRSNEPTSD